MSGLISVTLRPVLRGVGAIRQSTRAVLYRRPYCQNVNDITPKVTPAETSPGYSVYRNTIRPSDFDKKVLVWSGRFKKQEDIPETVSWEAIAAARSNIRIKVCMGMILSTVIGCILMVRAGKKALKEDDTLLSRNAEKKAKWKEEAIQEQRASLKSH